MFSYYFFKKVKFYLKKIKKCKKKKINIFISGKKKISNDCNSRCKILLLS